MRRSLWVSLVGMVLIGALGLGLPAVEKAAAAEYFAYGQSIASELLVSRTQRRILSTDDRADGSCNQRRFINATVVKAPEVRAVNGAIPERKWQEYWTLERCGLEVGYWVFFTEVGEGGAYFSILNNY